MRPEKWMQQTCGIAETEEEEEGQDEARTKTQASNVHCEWMPEGRQTWLVSRLLHSMRPGVGVNAGCPEAPGEEHQEGQDEPAIRR